MAFQVERFEQHSHSLCFKYGSAITVAPCFCVKLNKIKINKLTKSILDSIYMRRVIRLVGQTESFSSPDDQYCKTLIGVHWTQKPSRSTKSSRHQLRKGHFCKRVLTTCAFISNFYYIFFAIFFLFSYL